jgi:hypothetical protein
MTLRRTPAGLSHGEAPAGPAFLTLRLKPGWVLDAGGAVVRLSPAAKRRSAPSASATPKLPEGARLVAAIPQPLARSAPAGAAQAELARFVHLQLPQGAALGEWLERARSWEFVESAQLPPAAASLP